MPPSGTALAVLPNDSPISQLEKVVLEGNLASLQPDERVAYYARVCESLGLNPLTRPFEYITLNSKLVLYARRDAADQLRKLRGISVDRLERERTDDLAIVTAYGTDLTGRIDSAIGAVSIKGLSGEALANALMKAETKAKRRMTLSLAGLGWLDEAEVDTVTEDPDAPVAVSRRGRIASRTARLTGTVVDEQPAVEADSSGSASTPVSPGCDHKGTKTTATAQGVVCECGVLIAAREATPASTSRPKRSAAAAPKTAEDPDYWPARLHAVAAERGIDHEGVRVILAGFAEVPPGKLGGWSSKKATDEQYAAADAFIRELTAGEVDDTVATGYVWTYAVQHGLIDPKDTDASWDSLNTLARLATGGDPDDFTPAQWLAFAARVQLGHFDKQS